MGVPSDTAPGAGKALCSCRALYIGSVPTTDGVKGVAALQEPLRERYPGELQNVEGIDSTLSVFNDSILMKYNSSGHEVRFLLDGLVVCAAVRAVEQTDETTGNMKRYFVPVDEMKTDVGHPAVFAAIIRRNDGSNTPECHMYLCNSSREALHLVNTAASVSMALKRNKSQKAATSAVNGHVPMDDDIRIVSTEFVSPGEGVTREQPDDLPPETFYVKNEVVTAPAEPQVVSANYRTTAQVSSDKPSRYTLQQTDQAEEAGTIYVTFDKSNLIQTDDNTMQVVPSSNKPKKTKRKKEDTSERIIHQSDQQIIVEKPVYIDVPVLPPPQPQMVPVPRYIIRPPPPLARHVPVPFRPRPQPPPQMMFRPPMVRPNMPVRQPPPPVPMYVPRRMLSPPPQPPPSHFLPVPSPYRPARPRSASPDYERVAANSELRQSRYQPKWGKRPGVASDVGDFNRPGPFINGQPMPPRDFRRDENMFLNEKAFARHVQNDRDRRISRSHAARPHPTAYELHDAMLFDRGTTKSNPKYSSSESGP